MSKPQGSWPWRWRLRLRRGLWVWRLISMFIGAYSALMAGFLAAGYQLTRSQQMLSVCLPIGSAILIFWLSEETAGFRALVTALLREPLEPTEEEKTIGKGIN